MLLQRRAAGVCWQQHLAAARRAIKQAAFLPEKNGKKGLDAVAETAQEEALASVLAQPASVPTLLAAGVRLRPVEGTSPPA